MRAQQTVQGVGSSHGSEHMSTPHHLKRRRKKEDFDVRIGKEVMSQTQRQNQAVFIYCY